MPTPPSSPAQKNPALRGFEVDLAAGELRKNGTRIRLQEQPFQILVYLLDRAGEVVTREELRQKLWPADTFVDFDHSLNTAVNKLREALGDSASSPRYVETLARRGYRFLAPVATCRGKIAAAGFSACDCRRDLGSAQDAHFIAISMSRSPSQSDSRSFRAGSIDVSDLLRERAVSFKRNRSHHGHVFAGMGGARSSSSPCW